MKTKLWLAGMAVGLGLALGTVPAAEKKTEKKPKAWSAKMRELEAALGDVLFDISSDARFDDKKNFKKIEADAVRFAKLAHSVGDETSTAPDHDQGLGMVGSDFAQEADQAVKTLKAGHRAYARVILGTMTNYCVACHTRTNTGPSFNALKIDSRIEKLPALAKGSTLAAIREFDRALAEFERIVGDGTKMEGDVYDYERALRYGLSIAVRVKRDPDVALRLVEAAMKNAKAPYYLKAQAADWKKSIAEWKAEKPAAGGDAEKLLAEGARLVEKARSVQKFPADRSADIYYLRASGVVHEVLGLGPKGETAAKALYLAGLSYDVLYDYGVRDFGEFYYRACIRTTPHTNLARECYRRYEESVYFGYTGSGGTYIPSDVRARLNALELLSVPEPDPKASPAELR
ncbi:MAG: hypothetical protein JST04_07590 [Bdellovibrionales bacterium]|nr:hypothetical protein [Bdellovibrionales bacterium]